MTGRMFVAVAMLLLSSWAVRTVGHGAPVELRQPFSQFPETLGPWRSVNQRFTARIEDKLGVTDYVSRLYSRASTSVHLYVGFYSSQQHGTVLHSPKNCLPGNGWYIARRATTIVDVAPYDPFRANSYTVENGIDQQVVVYWYQQAGGRIVTNEYLGRMHLVFDALSRGRSDAAIIRVSVPFDDDASAAERIALDFLQTAYTAIAQFLPHDIASSGSRVPAN